jgi:hypothetical protein
MKILVNEIPHNKSLKNGDVTPYTKKTARGASPLLASTTNPQSSNLQATLIIP